MNKAILVGRLTRDPELRQTTGGISVARFTIAVNRRFARDGQQDADFINCVAWRDSGERIAKFFRKGNRIAVVGTIQTRSWDGADGKRQYSTEVVVDEWEFVETKAEAGNGGYEQPQFNAPQQTGTPKSDISDAPFDDFEAMGFAPMDGVDDNMPF